MDNNQMTDKEVGEVLCNFASNLYKKGVRDGLIVAGVTVGMVGLATLGIQKVIKKSKQKKSKEN